MCKILLASPEDLEKKALKFIISKNLDKANIIGETSTGREIVEKTKTLNPDIIIMEMDMPGINGIEVCEIIKNYDKKKTIILMGVEEEDSIIHKINKLKVDEYLLKPVRPKMIVDILKDYINDTKVTTTKNIESLLLDNISNINYRKSKELLREIIDDFRKVYDTYDSSEVIEFVKKLQNNMIRAGNIDYKVSSFNSYSIVKISKHLEKVLDEIFDEIMKENKLPQNSEIIIALNYIEKNFNEDVTLEDVANYVSLSSSYLSKLFKKETGINFSKYLTNRKIKEAKRMIQYEDMSVNDIAFKLGYNEPSYFCKVFKDQEGLTVSQYRDSIGY